MGQESSIEVAQTLIVSKRFQFGCSRVWKSKVA